MTKTKKQPRRCRACGKPEKKYIFGYTNLSPYSQICAECINRATRHEAISQEDK